MCVICGWFRTCGDEEMCLRLLKPVKRRRLLGLSHFAKQHHEDWGISPILPPLVRARGSGHEEELLCSVWSVLCGCCVLVPSFCEEFKTR